MNTNLPQSFYGLGIAPGILDIVDKLGFTVPTPIQHKAIPIALEGKDVMGVAQTGTGKTLAFGIPMVQRLMHERGRGLVLLPTRELALQVHETLNRIAAPFAMHATVLIGGESMMMQCISLRKNPRIIIATPGRLLDLIGQQRLRLDDVHTLVLDEADRMLDMGFQPQIESVLHMIPKERQTMLFSATMPPQIVKIASTYMKMPIRTEIAPSGTTAERVSQELFVVKGEHKGRLLGKVLDQYGGSILIFTRRKTDAWRVTRMIRGMGHDAAETHSDRSFEDRKEALEGFKSGRYRVLVATDIASRGLDVTGIELVINFDLPDDPENYVHRIGRTGRAGQTGHAISFATPDQATDVQGIERIIRTSIPVSEHPEVPSEKFSSEAPSSRKPQGDDRRRSGGHGRRSPAPRGGGAGSRGGHPHGRGRR